MKKIAFASGKGGAGKTSLSMSFHKHLKDNSVFADCDVDAADAFLLLEKKIVNSRPFASGYKYYIKADRCDNCGRCREVCAFGAIKISSSHYIEDLSCEGCGFCEDVCTRGAINRRENVCGDLFESGTIFGSKMVYARLIPGEDNSGKLVHEVIKNAHDLVSSSNSKYLVVDCPPGIGCPLIASITGADLLVVIIESSRAGFNDAQRLIELARKMRMPIIAIVNKSGINPSIDDEIAKFLKNKEINSAGTIQFSEEFVNILNRKELLIDSEIVSGNLKNIYDRIVRILE